MKTLSSCGTSTRDVFRAKWSQILTDINVYAHDIEVCEVGGKFKYIQIRIHIYTNINSAVWGKPFAI